MPSAVETVDIAIIGAGPAGCTLAALIKKYRPQTSVLVLEQARFPRHEIGESLLSDLNRVLADMGVLEAVEKEGFPRKLGATFIWGQDREPWDFLFVEMDPLFKLSDDYHTAHSFHVDRDRYDEILAECAEKHGAVIRQGCKATGVIQEGEAVVGVRTKNDDGTEGEVRARWVVDSAGGQGPLTARDGNRVLDDKLRNLATWSYFKGVDIQTQFNGVVGDFRTLIATHPIGWIWVIPLRNGVTSVGLVTSVETYRQANVQDPTKFLADQLRRLPEHEQLFNNIEPVDYRGTGELTFTEQEFSFSCKRVWGPGWILTGDAAGFVDPILSAGCFVVQAHAQFLAYALVSMLEGDFDEELALGSYASNLQANLEAFRGLTYVFYGFNSTKEDWWRTCSDLLHQSLFLPDASYKQAFSVFASGFVTRHALFEDTVNMLGEEFFSDTIGHLLGPSALPKDTGRQARQLVKGDPVLRFTGSTKDQPAALPKSGTGRLFPVRHVQVSLNSGDEMHGDAPGRRFYLPEPLARVPALLDGTRTISQVAVEVAGSPTHEHLEVIKREVHKVAYRLARIGAIERVDPSSG